MTPFSNNQIDIASLPQVEAVNLEPISPKYFQILVFNTIIPFAVFALAMTILRLFVDSDHLIMQIYWYIISVLIS